MKSSQNVIHVQTPGQAISLGNAVAHGEVL
jgi:hypothetical protein